MGDIVNVKDARADGQQLVRQVVDSEHWRKIVITSYDTSQRFISEIRTNDDKEDLIRTKKQEQIQRIYV